MKIEAFSTRWAGVVTPWLIEEQNWKSLHLGISSKKIDPITFRNLSRQPRHQFFLFFEEREQRPIGLVALSDINKKSKSARLWYLLGEKEYAYKGYVQRAVHECLKIGFEKMGLKSIHAWLVKENKESVQILENNDFKHIGCRRNCHTIDGKLYNRELYDVLATEFNSQRYTGFMENQPYQQRRDAIKNHTTISP